MFIQHSRKTQRPDSQSLAGLVPPGAGMSGRAAAHQQPLPFDLAIAGTGGASAPHALLAPPLRPWGQRQAYVSPGWKEAINEWEE